VTIAGMGAQLRGRKRSCVETVQEALKAARESNARWNVFLAITEAPALRRAAELDRELARGVDRGALHGIPIAHKDCFFTKDVRTTWGSKLFANFVPDRDAEVVSRLYEAGAVSIGKTNLHELTYGMTSNNPHFGPVRNPHDTERIAGGSSGGSGAALAARIVPLATGTDTGGSIRIPASFCGVVGFKPTYERVSREGCFPLGLTMDHAGPMARSVRDAAIGFRAMAPSPAAEEEETLRGVRVGVPANFFFERVDSQVAAVVRRAAHKAEGAGAVVEEVALPDAGALNTVGRVAQLCEAAAVLERYAHRREDFGDDVLALIDQGRMIPASRYINAQRARRMLAREFARVWEKCHCLLAPATPMVAPRIGETMVRIGDEAEDVRIAGTRLTRPINVLGWPALAMPCGVSNEGLPIGLQLIGAPGRDEQVLAWGAALEDVLP
jgi:aspartyl-tRNA(Asn)/glutamyl-tRNA(Gln) amidotransferase subunit A